jgi:TRAP-type C4-dicarboxylate transport system substrate-binding protein
MRAFGQMSPIATRLGATPVTVPSAEVSEALKTGLVDGDMAHPYAYVVLFNLYESSKYIFDYGTGLYFNYGFVISLDTWNKLPRDVQKTMEEVAGEMLDPYMGYLAESDAKATEAMMAHGNEFYRFPPEEVEKIKAMAFPVREELIAKLEGQGIPAREFVAKYEPLVKKYEPKSPYVHPFPK